MPHRSRTALVAGIALAVLTALPAAATSTTRRGNFEPFGTTTLDISGHAQIVTGNGFTKVSVHVEGLEPDTTYGSHLHAASCDDNMGGGHYKDDPAGPAEPPNELWLSSTSDPKAGVTANRGGVVHGDGSAPWVARPEAQSIVLHYVPPGGSTSGGPKVACADFS